MYTVSRRRENEPFLWRKQSKLIQNKLLRMTLKIKIDNVYEILKERKRIN